MNSKLAWQRVLDNSKKNEQYEFQIKLQKNRIRELEQQQYESEVILSHLKKLLFAIEKDFPRSWETELKHRTEKALANYKLISAVFNHGGVESAKGQSDVDQTDTGAR